MDLKNLYPRSGWKLAKTLLLMKLMTIIMLSTCLSASANGFSQQITLAERNVSLQKVLEKIRDQSGYNFLCTYELLQNAGTVTVNLKNASLREAISECLRGTELTYEIIGKTVVIKKKSASSLYFTDKSQVVIEDSIDVQGKVSDEDGAPLKGVSVSVKGTDRGTLTDLYGSYLLKVISPGKVLIFSFVGFKTVEVQVSNGPVINIVLRKNIVAMGEVIAIGYGTVKKGDVTGSISSLSSKDIGISPVSNSAQILQGKVAGVSVVSTSGAPGADVNVRIRGLGTINDNNPLYVIDGMPFDDMRDINPADIANIEILKDASASAIYGSRGANGVVLITTKRGSTGATKVTLESYVGVSSPWKNPKQLDASQYYDMIHMANQNGGTVVPANLETEYQKGYNTNWWDEYTQSGITQNYFLSASGGTEKAKYAVSGGYLNQGGIIAKSNYERFSFRSNVDFAVSNRIKAGVNLGFTSALRGTISEGARYSFGLISEGLDMDPLVPVINPNADVNDPDYEFNKYASTTVTDASNPVALIARTFNTSKRNRLIGNTYVDITLLDGLIFRSNLGLDVNNYNTYGYAPRYYLNPSENSANSTVSRGLANAQGLVWENTLGYTKRIGNNHNLSAKVGFISEEHKNEGFSGSKQGTLYNDETFRVLSAAATSDQITGAKGSNALLSYLGRVNYSYKDKYLVTATYRIDGSSRFAQGNNWGQFPSLALGWRISQESFFKKLNAGYIDNLKFRLGWGRIGNQNIPDNAYLSLVSGGNSRRYVLGGTVLQGYSPSNIGNPNIRWETVEQTNIAFDLSMFQNRFSMSADYYIKNTNDMLLNVPLPYYSGYPNDPWSNAGAVQNNGIELQFNYRNTVSDFRYEAGLNFTTIKNKVVSLGSQGAIFGGQSRLGTVTKTEVGHPIGSFFGFVTDGIFQNQSEIAAGHQPLAIPGDFRFKDIAGEPDANGKPSPPDGVINEYDKTYIGSPIPDFLIGFNLNLKYKSIDFSVFLQGSYGNQIYSATKLFTYGPVGYFNVSEASYVKAWHGPGTSNTQPIISSTNANDNYRNSTFYVENGSYLRIKNIQLGYTLPARTLKAINASNLRIFLSGENVFTFTKYSGLDPELGSSTLLDVGVDYGVYPQSRTFMAGISLNF
ncbi:MAG: TonB-dependent receptor [Ferruginibacter sp.]